MCDKYDVKMLKKIYGCSEEDEPSEIWLYHPLQLPFPPFIGLFICHDEIREQIENVTWDMGSEMFRVYVESDEEILFAHQNGKPHREESVILAEYLKKGWEIEEEEEGVEQ